MSDNERLSRELRNRADHGVIPGGGHPISFDDVKRSANKMKWQQRAAAGAVAAVVLAIAVPVGFAVTGGDNNTPPVAGNGTETPTPTVTPTQNTDGKYTLTLDAPEGDVPHISWLDGKTLHTANDDTFQLPKAYDDVVSYHGGFMGYAPSTGEIDAIRDGRVTESFAGSGFAVSQDGTLVAWFEQAGPATPGHIKVGIASGMGEGETSYDVPAGLNATPVAFRGSDVIYQTDDQSNGDRAVWYTDGDVTHRIDGAFGVGGYSDSADKASVMTKLSDEGSCWSLYSFPGGDSAGGLSNETCDYTLGQFSSDGTYVAGVGPMQSGWGPGDVSILDAKTLKPVVEFVRNQDYGVNDFAWDADSDSLIAIVFDQPTSTWKLLRLNVDGSMESASAAVQDDSEAYPFQLVSAR